MAIIIKETDTENEIKYYNVSHPKLCSTKKGGKYVKKDIIT